MIYKNIAELAKKCNGKYVVFPANKILFLPTLLL